METLGSLQDLTGHLLELDEPVFPEVSNSWTTDKISNDDYDMWRMTIESELFSLK